MSSGTQPDSPVGGDGVETGAGSAAPGRTGPIQPEGGFGSGNDGSGEPRPSLYWRDVEALAALLEPEAFDPDQPASDEWRKRTQDTALAYAAKVIASGYIRVSVDDDTTLAKALELLACVHHDDDCWFDHHGGCQAHGFLDLKPGEKCPQREIGELLAAVQALRDGSGT